MNIDELITIVKNKLKKEIPIQKLYVEDKSFLHQNHKGNQPGKYHLKINIKSQELKKINKIESNRIVHKILEEELSKYIHSIQILIS